MNRQRTADLLAELYILAGKLTYIVPREITTKLDVEQHEELAIKSISNRCLQICQTIAGEN
jgi:hypothetical protein